MSGRLNVEGRHACTARCRRHGGCGAPHAGAAPGPRHGGRGVLRRLVLFGIVVGYLVLITARTARLEASIAELADSLAELRDCLGGARYAAHRGFYPYWKF